MAASALPPTVSFSTTMRDMIPSERCHLWKQQLAAHARGPATATPYQIRPYSADNNYEPGDIVLLSDPDRPASARTEISVSDTLVDPSIMDRMAEIGEKEEKLRNSPYGRIAEAVAGRLGMEFHGTLFSYVNMERERALGDRKMYDARVDIMKNIADKLRALPPDATADQTLGLATQIQNLQALVAMATNTRTQIVPVSDITPKTIGALGDAVRPTALLVSNVDYAAALVAMQQRIHGLGWSDIWEDGDYEVRALFVELVSVCIIEARADSYKNRNARYNYSHLKERRKELLTLFTTMYRNETTRRWQLDYSTRALHEKIGDTTEAALEFVGY